MQIDETLTRNKVCGLVLWRAIDPSDAARGQQRNETIEIAPR